MKTQTPKAVVAKNLRAAAKGAASPQAIVTAIVGDAARSEALAALINASNAAFAAQKGLEAAETDADKTLMQQLLDAAQADVEKARLAIIAMWDDAAAGGQSIVDELRAKFAELEKELFGVKAELAKTGAEMVSYEGFDERLGNSAGPSTGRYLVVTAKQDSRWRAKLNFTKEPRRLELAELSAETIEAIKADPQLASTIEG